MATADRLQGRARARGSRAADPYLGLGGSAEPPKPGYAVHGCRRSREGESDGRQVRIVLIRAPQLGRSRMVGDHPVGERRVQVMAGLHDLRPVPGEVVAGFPPPRRPPPARHDRPWPPGNGVTGPDSPNSASSCRDGSGPCAHICPVSTCRDDVALTPVIGGSTSKTGEIASVTPWQYLSRTAPHDRVVVGHRVAKLAVASCCPRSRTT